MRQYGVRSRKTGDMGQIKVQEFITKIVEEVETRNNEF